MRPCPVPPPAEMPPPPAGSGPARDGPGLLDAIRNRRETVTPPRPGIQASSHLLHDAHPLAGNPGAVWDRERSEASTKPRRQSRVRLAKRAPYPPPPGGIAWVCTAMSRKPGREFLPVRRRDANSTAPVVRSGNRRRRGRAAAGRPSRSPRPARHRHRPCPHRSPPARPCVPDGRRGPDHLLRHIGSRRPGFHQDLTRGGIAGAGTALTFWQVGPDTHRVRTTRIEPLLPRQTRGPSALPSCPSPRMRTGQHPDRFAVGAFMLPSPTDSPWPGPGNVDPPGRRRGLQQLQGEVGAPGLTDAGNARPRC